MDFLKSYFTYSFTYFLYLFTLKVHFLQMARNFAISAPNETTNYRMMAYVYRRFSNLSFRCHQTPFDNLKLNINSATAVTEKIEVYHRSTHQRFSLQTLLMQICPWQHISVITKHMISFRTRLLNETRRNMHRPLQTTYILS